MHFTPVFLPHRDRQTFRSGKERLKWITRAWNVYEQVDFLIKVFGTHGIICGKSKSDDPLVRFGTNKHSTYKTALLRTV